MWSPFCDVYSPSAEKDRLECEYCDGELKISGEDGKYSYYKCGYCNSIYKENTYNGEVELVERGYSNKFLLDKALEYMDISRNDLIEMIEVE